MSKVLLGNSSKPVYAHKLKGEKDVYFLTKMKKPKKGVYLITCPNCWKTPKKELSISTADPRKTLPQIGKPNRWLICGHECWK